MKFNYCTRDTFKNLWIYPLQKQENERGSIFLVNIDSLCSLRWLLMYILYPLIYVNNKYNYVHSVDSNAILMFRHRIMSLLKWTEESWGTDEGAGINEISLICHQHSLLPIWDHVINHMIFALSCLSNVLFMEKNETAAMENEENSLQTIHPFWITAESSISVTKFKTKGLSYLKNMM